MTSSVSMTRLGRSAEKIYAIGTLFALTQGPVYRIWESSALSVMTSPEPTIRHVYFATFIVLQIPALVLLGRHLKVQAFHHLPMRLLIALIVWLGMSVTWSTLARHSLPEFTALVCTTSFGLFLATRYDITDLLKIVVSAMSLGLGLSLWSIWRGWNRSISLEQGYWIGIYYNRNSFAPVVAMLLIAIIGCRVLDDNRKSWSRRWLWDVIAVGAILFILWQTGSQTSWLAIMVALGFAMVWWVLRRRHLVQSAFMKSCTPAMVVLILFSVSVFLGLRVFGDLFGAQQETSVFSSRGPLWSLSWSAIQLKPVWGWGWMAAWHTPEFFKQGMWWAIWNTSWSHNGYHDVLLGGGAIAGALAAAYFLAAFASLDRIPVKQALSRLLVAVFVLTAATQESFFIGSHFLWSLLIAALTVDVVSVKQHNAGKLSS